jgi:tetratricopeptide (TPR) repeat protein/S1-C subfamily serine protease
MNSYRFDWARLFGAALLAAFLLTATLATGQVADPAKAKDETPPLPSKKTDDEDPPLPSKKPAPGKEIRVEVTAASAEVKSGDKVIATVRRGQMLPFTKKNDEYYLVIVDGKKGWIKRTAVREVEVTLGKPDGSEVEIPPGPTPDEIAKDTAGKVKQATAYLRVRLANGSTVEGSGFFASQTGLVITNAHVLGMLNPGSPMPAQVRVVVHSGEDEEFTLVAQVLAVDRARDLGVLRVKSGARRLPAPLPVDTSRTLELTQKVYIFGFPFGKNLGKEITVSKSSVSAIRKNGGSVTEVQVNGGMSPGNSGGPVVDSRGVVVGVAKAGINGTQINLAVPGEKVQELLRGRVAQIQLGEAFKEKDQAKLPIRLSCLDPLERVRSIKLEVWAGKATPARLPSLTEPKPLPGDGTRQSLPVTYKDGGAQIDVPIPSLEAGQVLWIRPVLTNTKGTSHWDGAIAYTPSDLPPLERKDILLQADFEHHAQRTFKLTASFNTQISKGPRQAQFREAMEIEILEASQKETRGGRFDLFFGGYKFTATDMKNKTFPVLPKAQALLRGRNMTFIVNSQGTLLERTVPRIGPPHPLGLREDFDELIHEIANTYEMTCLPVPNRRVQPRESWQARVPILLTYDSKKEIVDMYLTCTYEGRRTVKGQKLAVINLSGYLKGRKPGQQATAGTVTGKAHFAIDDGYLILANIKVESQGGDDDITVAHSLDVSLTRVRGNPSNIASRPVAAVPGPPPATGTDYEEAIPHLQKRDFDKAIPLLESAVKAKPNLVPALNDLGWAYNEKREFDKAIPCFKKVIDIVPNHVSAHNNLGHAYNSKGQFDDAIPCFKRAIELDRDHVAAHSNLGYAYNAKRQFDLAIPVLERAVELDERNVIALGNLGFAYNEKRLHDKAIACLKRVVELDRNNVTAHNGIGFAHNAKGQYEDAIPCFKKVLQLNPKHGAALNNLGFAFNAMGRYDQGIPYLKKTVEFYPKHAIAHDNLSAALVEAGELEQARDALKTALALIPETAPQFKAWKQNLEQLEALLHLPALADIVKGESKPKNFQEGLQFGKVCRVKKHYAAAVRLYEQAMKDDPEATKKLAPTNLIILARASLQASAGAGNGPPPEADRPKYRAKALAWLRTFLKAQTEALKKDFKASRHPCQLNLRLLLQHKDLAAVRQPALNNIPEAERKDWESFWDDVDALLEKAEAASPEP